MVPLFSATRKWYGSASSERKVEKSADDHSVIKHDRKFLCKIICCCFCAFGVLATLALVVTISILITNSSTSTLSFSRNVVVGRHDVVLVSRLNVSTKDIRFSNSDTNFHVYQENGSLVYNKTSYSNYWTFHSYNNSRQHVDAPYLVDGTDLTFTLQVTSSPYTQPLYGNIMVCSDYSIYKQFLSGDVIMSAAHIS